MAVSVGDAVVFIGPVLHDTPNDAIFWEKISHVGLLRLTWENTPMEHPGLPNYMHEISSHI